MANEKETDSVCDALQEAIDAGVLKVYDKEVYTKPASAGPVSYFAEIISSLHTDPCTYVGLKQTKCTLIASNVKDPDDGRVWDLYFMNCPTGPPCKDLR